MIPNVEKFFLFSLELFHIKQSLYVGPEQRLVEAVWKGRVEGGGKNWDTHEREKSFRYAYIPLPI